jgi:hypothetical protein
MLAIYRRNQLQNSTRSRSPRWLVTSRPTTVKEGGLVQTVRLDHSHTGRVIRTTHDGGVIARREISHNR